MSNPDHVHDPRKPGGKKWRVGKWVSHCRKLSRLNFVTLEQGEFPSVYVHWLSVTAEQKDFLLTLDPFDYLDYFNMFFFSYEADAIMFKLKGA